ncbi:MAG: FtsH protease activity modulator HflK [Opitutales bacterium]|nr:FtsH protease activity modulator HflK [Opitutales bacterium]
MRVKLPDGQVVDIPILRFLWIPLLAILVFGGSTMVYQVDAAEEGLVLRFGRHIDTVGPGLHFKFPYPVDTVIKVPSRIVDVQQFGYRRDARRNDGGFEEESSMLTGDLNIVLAGFDVQFSRAMPAEFVFNVNDPVETLRDISQSVMREIMGDRASIPILTVGRTEIQLRARELIQEWVDRFNMGIRINEVNLIFTNPPQPVRSAFNDLNKAEQDAVRFLEEASREFQERVPRARGQAERLVLEAEGFLERRVRVARGEADRFTQMLDAYRAAPEVTRNRLYLERFETFLPRLEEITIVDENLQSILPLLNLGDSRP